MNSNPSSTPSASRQAELVKTRVVQFVQEVSKETKPVHDQTVLVTSGLIDSLAVIDLIGLLESEFKVQFSSDELIPENFDTIASIVELVSKKAQTPSQTWN